MAKKRQKHLPGMKPPSHPRIDRAAEAFEDAKGDLGRAGATMKDTELHLRALMKEHKLEYYRTPNGIAVIHLHTDKVTTKKEKAKG